MLVAIAFFWQISVLNLKLFKLFSPEDDCSLESKRRDPFLCIYTFVLYNLLNLHM